MISKNSEIFMFTQFHEKYVIRKLFIFYEVQIMICGCVTDYGNNWIECSKSIQSQNIQAI